MALALCSGSTVKRALERRLGDIFRVPSTGSIQDP
jgi:hypothetical protein